MKNISQKFLPIILAALFLVTGCFSQKTEKTIDSSLPTTEKTAEKIPVSKNIDSSNKDQQILTAAANNDDLNKCKELSSENDQKACQNSILMNKAINNQDPKYCDQMSDATAQKKCHEVVK